MSRTWKIPTKNIFGRAALILAVGFSLTAAMNIKYCERIWKMQKGLWAFTWALADSAAAGESKKADLKALELWKGQMEGILASILPKASRESISDNLNAAIAGLPPDKAILNTTQEIILLLFIFNDACHAFEVAKIAQPIAPIFLSSFESRLKLKEQCHDNGPSRAEPVCAPEKAPEEKQTKLPPLIRLLIETPSTLACDQ